MCPGYKFALTQIKISVVKLLQNFVIETCEKTEVSVWMWFCMGLISDKNLMHHGRLENVIFSPIYLDYYILWYFGALVFLFWNDWWEHFAFFLEYYIFW